MHEWLTKVRRPFRNESFVRSIALVTLFVLLRSKRPCDMRLLSYWFVLFSVVVLFVLVISK